MIENLAGLERLEREGNIELCYNGQKLGILGGKLNVGQTFRESCV